MIAPGAVVWVEFDPVAGREQGGRRPAVVVSSDEHLAAASRLVTVVPATSTDRHWPNHIRMRGETGLATETFAMTEQVRTVSRSRVVAVPGRVDPACLSSICDWIHRWLAAGIGRLGTTSVWPRETG
jgi:mRNA interferase MazF